MWPPKKPHRGRRQHRILVCADCGKIFADKNYQRTEKEQTVIAKKTAENSGSSEAKDESKDKTATESDAPQTGDSTPLALWIALVALSGAAFGVVCLKKRKAE
ncbi:MAG: LPXTG cell wall anchor domain-containing protein [Acutalibacteraceae bacterium]